MIIPDKFVGATIDELTGNQFFNTDNGDSTGVDVSNSTDPGDDANVAKVDATKPPVGIQVTPTPAPTKATSGFDWGALLGGLISGGSNIVANQGAKGQIDAAANQAKQQADALKNQYLIIFGVILLVVILLYFVFRKPN